MQFLIIRDLMLNKLSKAQEKRKFLTDKVKSEHDRFHIYKWILYERETMLDGVNEERIKRGRTPIIMNDIIRAEKQAIGHSDYSSKFALYCAELVYGRKK